MKKARAAGLAVMADVISRTEYDSDAAAPPSSPHFRKALFPFAAKFEVQKMGGTRGVERGSSLMRPSRPRVRAEAARTPNARVRASGVYGSTMRLGPSA